MFVLMRADKEQDLLEQLRLSLGASTLFHLREIGVQIGQKEQQFQHLDLEIAFSYPLRDGVKLGKKVRKTRHRTHDEIPILGTEFLKQSGQVYIHIAKQTRCALGCCLRINDDGNAVVMPGGTA